MFKNIILTLVILVSSFLVGCDKDEDSQEDQDAVACDVDAEVQEGGSEAGSDEAGSDEDVEGGSEAGAEAGSDEDVEGGSEDSDSSEG